MIAFLDGLGARVEQHGALLVVAGGEGGQFFGDADVALVRGDHETGVGEVPDLLPDRLGDSRIGRADAGDGDARAEVDQRIAVDVDDHTTVGIRRVHGDAGADARGHGGAAASGEGRRLRAGELGDQGALLRQPVLDVVHVGAVLRIVTWMGIGWCDVSRSSS